MEKETAPFSANARLRSLKSAFQGILLLIRYEHNARIHLFAAGIAVLSGLLLHINKTEWIFIILCIALVIITETINTAVERLVDMVSPQKNARAGAIKDISAAAVLLSAFLALIIGMAIFLPHLAGLFKLYF